MKLLRGGIRTISFLAATAISMAAQVVPVVTAKGTDQVARVKDTIKVHVDHFQDWLNAEPKPDIGKLTLFLDGRPLTGVRAIAPPQGGDTVYFDLVRTEENKAVWNVLMRRPGFAPRKIEVSVGPEGGPRFQSSAVLALEIIREAWLFWTAVGVFLVLLAGFVWITRSSDILREPGPQPQGVRPDGKPNRKCYSLARFQMAFWFFVVVGSYFFIWLITWDRDTLTPTVLTLIGISAATGLGALVVDGGKRKSASEELSALRVEVARLTAAAAAEPAGPEKAALQAKATETAERITTLECTLKTTPSRNFIHDVLGDLEGVSFHRFQIFVWTLVLGIIFVISVYADMAMPEFSATMLGLMGISSGTYLGFKIPEQRS